MLLEHFACFAEALYSRTALPQEALEKGNEKKENKEERKLAAPIQGN